MFRLMIALLACCLLAPAQAAEGAANCTGTITSLPVVIATPGTWCLRQHLSTPITSGAAITIAANDITLDCNDFKVGGLPGNVNTNAVGISATDLQNITVRHCVVRGFLEGIRLAGASASGLIEWNRLDYNTVAGISVSGSGHLLHDNRIFFTGGRPASLRSDGIVSTADFCRILDNAVMGVSVAGSGGEVVGYSSRGNACELARNYLTQIAPPAGGAAVGIELGGSAGSTIHRNNLLSTAAGAGTAITSGADNQCGNNSYSGWASGIVGCTDGGSNFGN